MGKYVLVISSSLRVGGNSDILADEFVRGAKEAGNNVEKISLSGKTINFCKGCLACQKTCRCVMHDDADAIVHKMFNAEAIAFATPIYYYEMSGQLKTLLDRANPLYPSNYFFRDIYFIATAAEKGDETAAKAISGLEGWIDCFGKAKLAGTVLGMGVNDKGEVLEHPEMLKAAYEAGKSV